MEKRTAKRKRQWLNLLQEMRTPLEPSVFATQSAFLDLTELASTAANGLGGENLIEIRNDVEETMLAFIAAIICSDGFESDEDVFLKLLLDWHGQKENNVRLVNEYATRWALISKRVPRFFEIAVQYDKIHHEEIARAMLRSIQLIGNNACVSDKKTARCERQIVREYVSLLEASIE